MELPVETSWQGTVGENVAQSYVLYTNKRSMGHEKQTYQGSLFKSLSWTCFWASGSVQGDPGVV